MSVKIGITVLDRENLRDIGKELKRKRGRIFITEPGPNSYRGCVVDAKLSLYDHPLIRGECLVTERGIKIINDVPWQTNWERDRSYLLRKTREPSPDSLDNFCQKLFNRLILGPYEFSINFQAMVGMGLTTFFLKRTLIIYVPRDDSLESVFRQALEWIIGQMNHEAANFLLQEQKIGKIVSDMVEDLETGDAFNNNVNAGMTADQITGL